MSREISTTWAVDVPKEYSVTFFDLVDSTNTYLMDLAGSTCPHLSLAVARTQSAGKGRRSRRWISEDGNVYWSVLLRPEKTWPQVSTLPFVAALSIYETASTFLSADAKISIKWPNDILVNGKKVSGALLESRSRSTSSGKNGVVVVGIGINVGSHPDRNTLYPTTSLIAESATPVDRDEVIKVLSQIFLSRLDDWVSGGFEAISEAVRSRMFTIGSEVKCQVGAGDENKLVGKFMGIDDDGCMLLKTEEKTHAISTGDVFAL